MDTAVQEGVSSFEDFLNWDRPEHIEIIGGHLFVLPPPSRIHQEISLALCLQFGEYLRGKRGRVYAAPFCVRPAAEKTDAPQDIRDVFEPDLTVVCDLERLDTYGCCGAPDLVVEILSSSSARNDRLQKMNVYQRAGVREYWIVSPGEQTVEVFLLRNGLYQLDSVYGKSGHIRVSVLDDLTIDLAPVFEYPPDQAG